MTRFVLWDAHRTHEDSTAFLQHTIRKYETGGEPEWGIVYKAISALSARAALQAGKLPALS